MLPNRFFKHHCFSTPPSLLCWCESLWCVFCVCSLSVVLKYTTVICFPSHAHYLRRKWALQNNMIEVPFSKSMVRHVISLVVSSAFVCAKHFNLFRHLFFSYLQIYNHRRLIMKMFSSMLKAKCWQCQYQTDASCVSKYNYNQGFLFVVSLLNCKTSLAICFRVA